MMQALDLIALAVIVIPIWTLSLVFVGLEIRDYFRYRRAIREDAQRPGYIDLRPTPDRPRLGIDKRGPRR